MAEKRKKEPEKMTFEEASARLEEIVNTLETGSVRGGYRSFAPGKCPSFRCGSKSAEGDAGGRNGSL